MSMRLALIGVAIMASAPGPVLAGDGNPWRFQAPPPRVMQHQQNKRMQSPYSNYTYAPLDGIPARKTQLPPASPYGYGAPYGNYAPPATAGRGYPGMGYQTPGYPGAAWGGYPGNGLGGYPGGGYGPYPGGFGGGNGLTGPMSWMPFW